MPSAVHSAVTLLGVVIAGANVPDFQLLGETIEAVVVERPDPEEVARE